MSHPYIHVEGRDPIVRLVLNRPDKRNALTRDMLNGLSEAVESVRAEGGARLLVLTGAGPAFCAGMDLSEMQARAESPDAAEQWREDTRVYREVLWNLFTLPIPTLAVVQGPAIAGGLGLLLACDIVLSAESAFFALPEPKRGITAAVVAPFLLHRVGFGIGSYVLLSGRNLSAADAFRVGLCHELAPSDELPRRAEELILSILSGAPAALSATKQHLIECCESALYEQLDEGMHVSALARQTADAREGLAAFLEKRPPCWTVKELRQIGE